jgi:hypothetical protein
MRTSAVPITGSRSISSVTKYNANAGSGGSFVGQDSRLLHWPGADLVFNVVLDLVLTQGEGRTGSTAISLDAIEQCKLILPPYDVRQSGFLGSGINAVTKSGFKRN